MTTEMERSSQIKNSDSDSVLLDVGCETKIDKMTSKFLTVTTYLKENTIGKTDLVQKNQEFNMDISGLGKSWVWV